MLELIFIMMAIVLSVIAILMAYRTMSATAIKEYQTGVHNINCWPVDKMKEACMSLNDPPKEGSWRTYSKEIKFTKPFSAAPTIKFSVISHDVENGNRYDVFATKTDTEGFTLNVTTWGNTAIYSMNVEWTAVVLG